MGWGDDLMWLGDADDLYKQTGRRQRPTENGRTRPQSPLWQGCDCVDMRRGDSLAIREDGLRPYRQPKPWQAKPARLTLSEEEKRRGLHWLKHKPYWLIQPHTKQPAHYTNKQWPLAQWQQLVDMIHRERPEIKLLTLVEKTAENLEKLQGVEYIITEHIRLTLPAMQPAQLVITQEGYWHHLAAAYARPCAVLYGGNTSPHRSEEHQHWGTGYEGQLNITAQSLRLRPELCEQSPCYSRQHCEHCDQVWQQTSATEVWWMTKDYIKEREL